MSTTTLEAGDLRQLGGYRLVAELGSGGMGVVYLARADAGQLVAIKVIRPEFLDDDEFHRRFEREVDAAVRVSCPWTARVLDVDMAATTPYLVTEYVPGDTLLQRVEREGPLEGPTAVAVGAGLAAGLAAVHAAGVVHRDVTPSNVILTPEGPKLIDLGVAAIEDSTRITRTGMSFGTPSWMAPEQAQGQPVSAATDVFAWGAVMAFAATGRAPFGTGRAEAVLYRIVHQEPDLEGVPAELAATIATALNKDPLGRPSAVRLAAFLAGVSDEVDAGDLTPEVSSLIATSPLPASTRHLPPNSQQTELVTPQPREVGGRHPWRRWLLTAAALTVLAVGGALMTPWGPGRPTAAPVVQTPPSPGPVPIANDPPASPSPSPTPAPSPSSRQASKPESSRRTPRFESSEVMPTGQEAYDLFALMRRHVGDIVYLDVRFPDGPVDVHPNESPAYIFVPGSYPPEGAGDFCSDEPIFCGAEYLVRDVGDATDSGLYWIRQQWRLHGYFAVSSIEGPFQGSYSVSLRAVPITQVS